MSENVQQKRRLTPKQRRAIEALLSGQTKTQASAAAGVTLRTLARWRDIPVFEEELRRRSTKAVSDATLRLTGTLDLAVATMRDVMEDKDAAHSVRLRAAKIASDSAIRLLEVTEVLERIESLEAVIGDSR